MTKTCAVAGCKTNYKKQENGVKNYIKSRNRNRIPRLVEILKPLTSVDSIL